MKNKTLTVFLATFFGTIGAARFYLYGIKDKLAWCHIAALICSGLLILINPTNPLIFNGLPFILSFLVSTVYALIIGTTSDQAWDAKHNQHTKYTSQSGGLLAVFLILTLIIGAIVLIASIARVTDVLLTNAAFG